MSCCTSCSFLGQVVLRFNGDQIYCNICSISTQIWLSIEAFSKIGVGRNCMACSKIRITILTYMNRVYSYNFVIHQYQDYLAFIPHRKNIWLLSTKRENGTEEPLAKITRLIELATIERKWAAAVVPDIIFDRWGWEHLLKAQYILVPSSFFIHFYDFLHDAITSCPRTIIYLDKDAYHSIQFVT